MTVTAEKLMVGLALADMTFLSLNEKLLFFREVERAEDFVSMKADDFSLRVNRVVKARIWESALLMSRVHLALKAMSTYGIRVLFNGDFVYTNTEFAYTDNSAAYPPQLAAIFNAPFALFVRGNPGLLTERSIAVVGTRKPTMEGMRAASDFAKAAAAAGDVVVSGLAYGIDACAHNGALSIPEGKTAAVLAGGIDTFSPAGNKRIAARILEHGGCVVSEYLPGSRALAWRFIQRNRIIASLTRGTVVIDAPGNSGALITARFAVEEGRDVYIHRVSVDKSGYEAANYLVRDGASVIDSYEGVH